MSDVLVVGGGRQAIVFVPRGTGAVAVVQKTELTHRVHYKIAIRWIRINHTQTPGLELLFYMAQDWCSCRHSFTEHPLHLCTEIASFLWKATIFSKGNSEEIASILPFHFFFLCGCKSLKSNRLNFLASPSVKSPCNSVREPTST